MVLHPLDNSHREYVEYGGGSNITKANSICNVCQTLVKTMAYEQGILVTSRYDVKSLAWGIHIAGPMRLGCYRCYHSGIIVFSSSDILESSLSASQSLRAISTVMCHFPMAST